MWLPELPRDSCAMWILWVLRIHLQACCRSWEVICHLLEDQADRGQTGLGVGQGGEMKSWCNLQASEESGRQIEMSALLMRAVFPHPIQ